MMKARKDTKMMTPCTRSNFLNPFTGVICNEIRAPLRPRQRAPSLISRFERSASLRETPIQAAGRTTIRRAVRTSIAAEIGKAYKETINLDMNAKFEWFGFSVARKHVYFYTLLVAVSICANSLKSQLIGPTEAELASSQMTEVQDKIADLKFDLP
jgi:hypothetical protein